MAGCIKNFLACILVIALVASPGSFAMNGADEKPLGSDPEVYFNDGAGYYAAGDFDEALVMFKVAALAGSPEAAIQVGLMYDFGLGAARSFHEARRWYLKAAMRNHPRALYLLGHMEEFGEGRIRDYSKAFGWYQKAAALGETNAQFSLGEFYSSGKFVHRDPEQAVRWLSLAAGQCHDQAWELLQGLAVHQLNWDPGVCF